MIGNISTKDLVLKVLSWRRKFLWISIATVIVSGVLVFLIPKQYKSTVVMFATRQFSVSKLVIEANAGNQEDYIRIGDADDLERLMQLMNSDELKMRVADRFDLWKRWRVDKDDLAYHYLRLKWDDQVSTKRTEYGSIKLEVYDYTANGAAELANGIAQYADSVKADMNRNITRPVMKIVEEEYNLTLNRMKELEDSLQVLREMGVLHYKEQVKAYAKAYAKAVDKNDVGAMKRLEGKMDTLSKYGGAYQIMHDNLDKYSSKYPDIKMKYDEALVNYRSMIPVKFVVQPAYPNEFKAKPSRLMLMIISLVATNLLGLFVMLIKEKFWPLPPPR